MSDEIRDQAEDPHAHEEIRTARSLADATNAGQSLQGYAAMNDLTEDSEIASLAHGFFLQRKGTGKHGSAEDDWFRAEQQLRDRQNALKK
ncbi:MAG: hypothetical protein H7039_12890 [Bryobacteraceae bacterium]|nr:hypothetical protein [Bryobacteraceae bacterium]